MPIIGDNDRDRVADALEELCLKLEEHLISPRESQPINLTLDKISVPPPVVNVAAPTVQPQIKVEPFVSMDAPKIHVDVPAPVVNVSAPDPPKRGSWTFTVFRDTEDRIKTITVDPK